METFIKNSSDLVVGTLGSLFPKRTDVETVIIKEVETHAKPMMSGSAFVRLAGLAGGSAVMMAAYGAHAFPAGDDEENIRAKTIFESGNKMHIMHSVALLGVPLTRRPKLISNWTIVRFGLIKGVGSVMITGLALFSGTCYYSALTGDSRVRRFTPYGGMLLILSWFLMLL